MERFNIRCPDHYPMKCNLSPADKDYLLTSEKYKAFFIFQYKNQDKWLRPTMESYFSNRTWRLFNAEEEAGTGTKFCNICRFALASDFGVVSLTPLNYNVFQEVGLMEGLQKPLLYILNPERLKNNNNKLPFDIDDQIYIEHKDKETLISGLDKKISLILDKIQLLSGSESEKRKYIKNKLNALSSGAREILKVVYFEGTNKFSTKTNELNEFIKQHPHLDIQFLEELIINRFIVTEAMAATPFTLHNRKLNESYYKYLGELLWEQ